MDTKDSAMLASCFTKLEMLGHALDNLAEKDWYLCVHIVFWGATFLMVSLEGAQYKCKHALHLLAARKVLHSCFL